MDSSPMNKLPGELRNRIYELVVYFPEGYHFRKSGRRGRWRDNDGSDNVFGWYDNGRPHKTRRVDHTDLLAITKTCKKMRRESLGIFYSINTFTFYPRMWCFGFKMTRSQMRSYSADLSTLRQWLKRIGKDNAASIKNLILDLDAWNPNAPQGRQQNTPPYLVPMPTGQWNREWWQMARKLERKIIHRYVEPACIKVSVEMPNLSNEAHEAVWRLMPGGWKRPKWVREYTTYLLSATDKSKAVEEIRRLCEQQNDVLDKDLRPSLGDPGSQIRQLLRSAIELNRDLMLNAVGEEVKKQDMSDRLAALSLT